MSALSLNYQIHGEGTPLVILHGLFGTMQNWGAQIKALAEQYQIIAVDLRDHGRSPHSEQINYPLMAKDVIALLEQLGLEKVYLLGHSMGGKVGMQIACERSELIEKLIITDIAPVSYHDHHSQVFTGLRSIDLESLKSRGEADKILSQHVEEAGVRAFLLTNLYRDQGQFAWRMNLEVLYRDYANLRAAPELKHPFEGKTLFIKGGQSDYLLPEYQPEIMRWFPKAGYKIIADAGHWPHAEKPELFTSIVKRFLGEN